MPILFFFLDSISIDRFFLSPSIYKEKWSIFFCFVLKLSFWFGFGCIFNFCILILFLIENFCICFLIKKFIKFRNSGFFPWFFFNFSVFQFCFLNVVDNFIRNFFFGNFPKKRKVAGNELRQQQSFVGNFFCPKNYY